MSACGRGAGLKRRWVGGVSGGVLFYFLIEIIKIQCEVKSASACAHTKREEEEEG